MWISPFFYSTFVLSIWIWLFLLSSLIVRITCGVEMIRERVVGIFDFNQKPISCLGYVVVIILTVTAVAGIPLRG